MLSCPQSMNLLETFWDSYLMTPVYLVLLYHSYHFLLFWEDPTLRHIFQSFWPKSRCTCRQNIQCLIFIRTVVDTARQALLFKFCVYHIGPLCSPQFQSFRFAPVGGGNSIKHIVSIFVSDALSILVQMINSVLFGSPGSIRIQRPDWHHDMKMWIYCSSFKFKGLCTCPVVSSYKRPYSRYQSIGPGDQSVGYVVRASAIISS